MEGGLAGRGLRLAARLLPATGPQRPGRCGASCGPARSAAGQRPRLTSAEATEAFVRCRRLGLRSPPRCLPRWHRERSGRGTFLTPHPPWRRRELAGPGSTRGGEGGVSGEGRRTLGFPPSPAFPVDVRPGRHEASSPGGSAPPGATQGPREARRVPSDPRSAGPVLRIALPAPRGAPLLGAGVAGTVESSSPASLAPDVSV